jgi:hypothetical protein
MLPVAWGGSQRSGSIHCFLGVEVISRQETMLPGIGGILSVGVAFRSSSVPYAYKAA